ncbi:tRNA (guanosine(37)-N1)-methyltransferase TrmD [Nanchangia anserum]|uniref:tRNA (guanine-N(1)-)-methyltransferase n=1 Tax=Nanchangia anserum TaxID=2692125 RepID=A0A8I0GB23_9ACTO|nr:tRNA (guanosine(37)-N1)-methyltransferase TrmD [Nanchangia anserum]MBD3688996.1 tRNA (guanosine(37)-N1)-methyltransferase TrmD [Nanchangia anserum]QOX81244.1 tRNA (guanosine(37)-N1)-methyltransferase TrmD [Nanchangia anserum]
MVARFDVVTIFPEFFSVLDVSLLGKAGQAGTLEFGIHDLREWASGRHRSVDDTPYGGGAGMVMRADVWGRALDDVIAAQPSPCVVAVPTPAGEPLTQRRVAELAQREGRIVVACGRYEGIDRRVIDHYAQRDDVDVWEFSLGDYVLNGGEVAALALIEAVGRLVTGVVGNPASLVEESHSGAGLLEYPAYTRPPSWRGLDVPGVLREGNHAKVDRWRRDAALAISAARRPDVLSRLLADLDRDDRAALARAGVVVDGDELSRLVVRPAHPDEAEAVSELAIRLFPDACPPEITPDQIARHVAHELSPAVLRAAIDSEVVTLAEVEGRLIGYAYLAAPPAPYVGDSVTLDHGSPTTVAYLSKLYVDPTSRGGGVAVALLEAALREGCQRWGLTHVLLGTNTGNRRARTFYRRTGFRKKATRTYDVGGVLNRDVVLVRDLTAHPVQPDLTGWGAAWNNDSGTSSPRDLPQGERTGE